MNTKQGLKLIAIFSTIIATIFLFLGAVSYYKASPAAAVNYSVFEMAFKANGFSFGHFLLILLTIASLTISIVSLYKDDNKILPLIVSVTSLIACILAFLTGTMVQKPQYYHLILGGVMLGILLGLAAISSIINSIRLWILKKND